MPAGRLITGQPRQRGETPHPGSIAGPAKRFDKSLDSGNPMPPFLPTPTRHLLNPQDGMIGAAIAKSQAASEVAAGGDGVTVIPLDSIASIGARKSTGISGWLGGQSLLLTTANGAEYRFGVKLDRWSADLASALAARSRGVVTIPQGMAVIPL